MKDTQPFVIATHGNARVINGEWHIIHTMDTSKLIDQNEITKRNIEKLTNTFNTTEKEGFRAELERIYYIIEHNTNIINNIILHRFKRGLINGLGTIIKDITGNLDQEDLEKLQTRLETEHKLIEHKISITSNILDDFHNKILNLTHNQLTLWTQMSHRHYLNNKLSLLTNILFNAETLYELLERLATAWTFANHDIFHYAIIKAKALAEVIQHIPKDQMITLDITALQKHIHIETVQSEHALRFLIKIPLVEPNTYEYTSLVPTILNSKNQCTYPISQPRRILRSGLQIYQAESCDLYNEYICTKLPTAINECETAILRNEEATKCNTTTITCPDNYVYEITRTTYLIYSKEEQILNTECNNVQKHYYIKGTILITNYNCKVTFKNKILISRSSTMEQLQVPELTGLRPIEVKQPLMFEDNEKEINKQIAHLKSLEFTPMYHEVIGINIITITVIGFIGIGIWIIYNKIILKRKTITTAAREAQPLQNNPSGIFSNLGGRK